MTLNRLLTICFLLFVFSAKSAAQYYIRGEIRDDKGSPLQNVRIVLHSSGIPYFSGIGGAFGIMTTKAVDSMSFTLDGYEPVSMSVQSAKYQEVILKMMPFTANLQRYSLLSVTRDMEVKTRRFSSFSNESYNLTIENDFIVAEKYPETAVVLNVDRASYSNIRRFVKMESEVPPDAVRIEEMLNYFSINFSPPGGDSIFRIRTHLSASPLNVGKQLFFVNVHSKRVDLDKVPPSNLVFLIDASGSMDLPNRLPLLKVAFRKLVTNLRAIDTVSIVIYGDVTGVMLQPTGGNEKEKILKAIEDLEAGGSTPGESGILQAYKLAQRQFIKGGNNRVILATDGDFNVGKFSEKELEELITRQKQSGVYLTCLGVGMGNYKDSKIEILAKKGNGNFAYLDSELEAEKVLVKEFTQTLYAVADDVYMNVRFNPELVKSYRLMGFDNKLAALADTNRVLEGGEMGSGHAMLAIFEIVPTEKNLQAVRSGVMRDRIAQVDLHFKLPGQQEDLKVLHNAPWNYLEFQESEQFLRFAASVAMYGSMLRHSPHLKGRTWEDVLALVKENINQQDPFQVEFYDIVQRSYRIYVPAKKRKKT